MTKNRFEKFDKETVYCNCCKRDLSIDCFSYSYIKEDGTASRCKFCDWIKRHNGIPHINNYDEEVIKNILEDIIFNKIQFLNDLSSKYNITIDDIIKIIKTFKIGNRKFTIKTNCANCGKEIKVVLSVYEKNEHSFCSTWCYYEYKKKTSVSGKENDQYNRIKTNCANCGKEIEVIPYEYNLKNSFGDRHNFCSQQCYWQFRSKYYVGDKSITRNREITEDERNKMRKMY